MLPNIETVFLLEVVTIIKEEPKTECIYQPFRLHDTYFSIHASKEYAENAMNAYKQTIEDIYCFYIYEIPFSHLSFIHSIESLKTWLYNKEGNQLDERLYPSHSFGKYFCGRPTELLRFQVGDVVEYYGELGIVMQVPCEKYETMHSSNDDVYVILPLEQDFIYPDEPKTFPVSPLRLMAPTFPIMDKARELIYKVRDFYIP